MFTLKFNNIYCSFAKYTRRGGVDISPFRTNLDAKNTEIIKVRDVRQ